MNSPLKFFASAVLGGLLLVAAPRARAQVSVSVNVGAPAWGPPAPPTAQYYYIPEIDGYYDLYTQQYIVFQDGYWVPLPALYGYDPYQFHPVIIGYRGQEPWLQRDYYHRHYAYRPYQPYGAGRGGYYGGGGRPGYAADRWGPYYPRESRGYDSRSSRGQVPAYTRGDYNRADYHQGDYNRANYNQGTQAPQQQPQPGQYQQGGRGYGPAGSYEPGRQDQGRPARGYNRGEGGRSEGWGRH